MSAPGEGDRPDHGARRSQGAAPGRACPRNAGRLAERPRRARRSRRARAAGGHCRGDAARLALFAARWLRLVLPGRCLSPCRTRRSAFAVARPRRARAVSGGRLRPPLRRGLAFGPRLRASRRCGRRSPCWARPASAFLAVALVAAAGRKGLGVLVRRGVAWRDDGSASAEAGQRQRQRPRQGDAASSEAFISGLLVGGRHETGDSVAFALVCIESAWKHLEAARPRHPDFVGRSRVGRCRHLAARLWPGRLPRAQRRRLRPAGPRPGRDRGLVGAAGRRRGRRPAPAPAGDPGLVALGLLAAFVAWTALQPDLDRERRADRPTSPGSPTYLGVFALALFSRAARREPGAWSPRSPRRSSSSPSSRCSPACTPPGSRPPTRLREFLSDGRERLSYPLNYWNGLAALIAIGLPLMLQIATGAATVACRALAAAALPALALAALLHPLARRHRRRRRRRRRLRRAHLATGCRSC